jgi:hypothetical protein
MARTTIKPSKVSKELTEPTLNSLPPRDALAVELALERVRHHGKLGVDVAKELVNVADEIAVLLGWQKAKKTPKQAAEEELDTLIERGEA